MQQRCHASASTHRASTNGRHILPACAGVYLPGYCSVRSRPCGAAYRLRVVRSAGGSERARPPRG